MPLSHGFPVLELFLVKIFLPFDRRQRALGAVMAFLVASSAAISLDVVEQLALGVVGYVSPFDRRGRVGSFEAGRETALFFVGRCQKDDRTGEFYYEPS